MDRKRPDEPGGEYHKIKGIYMSGYDVQMRSGHRILEQMCRYANES